MSIPPSHFGPAQPAAIPPTFYILVAQFTPLPDTTDPNLEAESAPQSRLPVELINRIASILRDQHARGTLAVMQRASRSWYSIINPILYSIIGDTTNDFIQFFKLFEVLLHAGPGLITQRDDLRHPIEWSSTARILLSLSRVHQIVIRPVEPLNILAFVKAARPIRDVYQLLEITLYPHELFPEVKSVIVDFGQYQKSASATSGLDFLVAQADVIRNSGSFLFAGRRLTPPIKEIHIPSLFFDTLEGLSTRHLCLTQGDIGLRSPSRSIGRTLPLPSTKTLVIHQFDEGFGRFPMVDDITIHFRTPDPKQYHIPGDMGKRLLELMHESHQDGGIFGSIRIKIFRIVEPEFHLFSEQDRDIFETGMNGLFPKPTSNPDTATTPSLFGNTSSNRGPPMNTGFFGNPTNFSVSSVPSQTNTGLFGASSGASTARAGPGSGSLFSFTAANSGGSLPGTTAPPQAIGLFSGETVRGTSSGTVWEYWREGKLGESPAPRCPHCGKLFYSNMSASSV